MRKTIVGEYALMVDDMKIKYIVLLFSFVAIYVSSHVDIILHNKFSPEAKYFWYAFFSVLFTTLFFQLNVGFHSESINEFLYLLVPFLFVSCVVSADESVAERLVESCFFLTLLCYFLTVLHGVISGLSIYSISFVDSFSPFENELSPYFVYFEIYYLFKGNKKRSFLCVVLTFLSLKRFCLLKAILFYILFAFTDLRKIDKRLFWLTIIAFILLPVAMEYLVRADDWRFLEELTGQDAETFTMSRSSIFLYTMQEIDKLNFGFGTTVYLLQDWAAQSLHSDILRLYLEGTLFVTIVYTMSFFHMVRNYNLYTFLIFFQVFSEGIFNHWMLGAGITCQWIIIYLMIFTINRSDKLKDSRLVSKLNYKSL